MKDESFSVNKNTTLYNQVKDSILKRITDGVWAPKTAIPTEIELMNEFNVSKTTIRMATTLLVQEGMLEKTQGKGTFVKQQQLVENLGVLTGFAEEVIRKGFKPGAKMLKYGFKDTLFYEKSLLQVSEDEKILFVERIRFMDYIPVAIEKTYWPNNIGNRFIKNDLNLINFYEVLQKEGIILKKAKEQISAVNASAIEAEFLGIDPGTALLEMTRITYGVDDKPVEYAQTRYRTDYYKYDIELKK